MKIATNETAEEIAKKDKFCRENYPAVIACTERARERLALSLGLASYTTWATCAVEWRAGTG